MPEQEALPLEPPKTPNRFVIPDDPVVTPSGKSVEPAVAPAVEKPAEPKEVKANKEESAPSAEPEAKPETEVTPEQLAAKRDRRAQNKLEKAYRVRAEALAKAELLEKRLAELEKPKPATQEGEPRLEQFDYDPEKYAQAKAEYARTQAAKEFEAKQRAESQTQAQRKLESDWEEKVAKGEEKYDDWEEKVGTLKPTAPFIAALMEADNGEDIAHYLGSHPKEAQRIAGLQPLSQVREIGKLEAKLSSKTVEPKVPSKAPAPITPLTGTAPSTSNEPSEQDDTDAWIKKRQRQVHGRR